MNNVQLFTTSIIDGRKIENYYGIITANQVAGTGFLTDLTASFSDLFGGNSGAYRESMNKLYRDVTKTLKDKAVQLGANAVVGVSIDYDNISAKGMSMFMVSIQGTAVKIADSNTEIHKSKENEISLEELNLAYYKRKICRKIESDELISDSEWDFLLKNEVDSLTPLLYQYYQECVKKYHKYLPENRPRWINTALSNFRTYLSKLDYNEAIKYVYRDVDKFKDIMTNNKLFSALNILNIAKEGKLSVAISILDIEKSSYNSQDLTDMQELANYLKNLPDVGKKEDIKGGLLSSGGMKFICSCGKKNEISSEYCSSCGKNIKGINKQEQQAINNYLELVETLAEIMK